MKNVMLVKKLAKHGKGGRCIVIPSAWINFMKAERFELFLDLRQNLVYLTPTEKPVTRKPGVDNLSKMRNNQYEIEVPHG